MIVLRDTVEIKASPEQVFDWLVHLDEHYLAWHPDHVRCRCIKGRMQEAGSVVHVEEYLHGRLHQMKLRTTAIEPNQHIDYRVAPGLRGSFDIEPEENHILFTAELGFGTRFPILSPLLDWMLFRLLPRQIAALREHMAEEGANLKHLLEKSAA
ncbi:MAG: SRPBCC family protein [Candidatus Neomarinimicrobiota bacterium]